MSAQAQTPSCVTSAWRPSDRKASSRRGENYACESAMGMSFGFMECGACAGVGGGGGRAERRGGPGTAKHTKTSVASDKPVGVIHQGKHAQLCLSDAFLYLKAMNALPYPTLPYPTPPCAALPYPTLYTGVGGVSDVVYVTGALGHKQHRMQRSTCMSSDLNTFNACAGEGGCGDGAWRCEGPGPQAAALCAQYAAGAFHAGRPQAGGALLGISIDGARMRFGIAVTMLCCDRGGWPGLRRSWLSRSVLGTQERYVCVKPTIQGQLATC